MEPPPTLHDLVKEIRIPLALLNKKCSDEHLKSISLFLDWRTVAPYLGLSETDIQDIDIDSRTESEKRLKTLQMWKRKYGFRARFKNLMQALLKVSNADHAERVCRLLQAQGGSSWSELEAADIPVTKSTEVLPSTTIEGTRITMEQKMEMDVRYLEDRFFDVIRKAAHDLENTQLSEVKLCVTHLPASIKYPHIKLLQGNLTAINKAKSVGEIFSILALYWDFLNCGLLKEIVRKLGSDNTKQLMETYMEELKTFRMKTKLGDYIGKVNRKDRPHFTKFCTKLEENWRDNTLEDLEQLRIEQARSMQVVEYALSLDNIMSSIISVTWALPSSLPGVADTLQSIFPLLEEEYDVLTVVFQGKHIPELSELAPLEATVAVDPPELMELVEEVHIPRALFDQRCSDEHLERISEVLDWRKIAPHLGLSEREIQEIESAGQKDTEKRMKALQRWKMKYGFKATFKIVVMAILKSRNPDRAKKVCRLLKPQVHKGDSQSDLTTLGNEPHGSSLTPGIKTGPQEAAMEREIEELEEQFSDVVSKAEDDIKKCPLSTVKQHIMELPPSIVSYEYVCDVESVSEIFTSLKPYWGFFNCGLLNKIVHKLGSEVLKQFMEKYLEKLKDFQMKMKLEDFKWTRRGGNPPNFTHIQIAVIQGSSTLRDLEPLRSNLAHSFKLEEIEILLTGTTTSDQTILIDWAVPKSTATATFDPPFRPGRGEYVYTYAVSH